jgi:hypothetical protein
MPKHYGAQALVMIKISCDFHLRVACLPCLLDLLIALI